MDALSVSRFHLACCIGGNFLCFSCRLLTFFKFGLFKKLFQEHLLIRLSNGLDPDQVIIVC